MAKACSGAVLRRCRRLDSLLLVLAAFCVLRQPAFIGGNGSISPRRPEISTLQASSASWRAGRRSRLRVSRAAQPEEAADSKKGEKGRGEDGGEWPRGEEDAVALAAAVVPAAVVAAEGGPVVAAAAAAASLTWMGFKVTREQKDNLNVLAFAFLAACSSGAWFFATQGLQAGAEWFSCYFIEYALSVDNLFVFILIFRYFKVPDECQSKVLTYGILGAIVFRFLFVYMGSVLLGQFKFLILLFAGILLYASFKGLTGDDDDDEEEDLENNFAVQTVRSVIEISPRLDGENFFTQIDGRSVATPLLLVLCVIEFSDIVFATDSVPAVLTTTSDPLIAYSSNVFAIFGLRSLYSLLKEAMVNFEYLETAVNIVLGYVGAKILLCYVGVIEIPVLASFVIILGTLGAGVGLSIASLGKEEAED